MKGGYSSQLSSMVIFPTGVDFRCMILTKVERYGNIFGRIGHHMHTRQSWAIWSYFLQEWIWGAWYSPQLSNMVILSKGVYIRSMILTTVEQDGPIPYRSGYQEYDTHHGWAGWSYSLQEWISGQTVTASYLRQCSLHVQQSTDMSDLRKGKQLNKKYEYKIGQCKHVLNLHDPIFRGHFCLSIGKSFKFMTQEARIVSRWE